jgi:hypothetical protein
LSVNKALLYLLAKQAFASKGRLIFPFANKNEVFRPKQGFGESWKTSKAFFLRTKLKY